jgi:hypothetical protein
MINIDFFVKIYIIYNRAINGYGFKTIEWINYFSKYLWYKPNSKIINNVEVLDEHQKKMFEYLTN